MKYEVKLHARVREVLIYRGNDVATMWSHVYAVASALEITRQSAEIEISEDGHSDLIEVDKGRRLGKLTPSH